MNSFCQQGSLAVKLLPLLVLLGVPLLPCPGCKDSPIWHPLGIVPGSWGVSGYILKAPFQQGDVSFQTAEN